MRPRIVYKEIVGVPSGKVLEGILSIMKRVFAKVHLTDAEYTRRLKERRLIYTVLAYHEGELIAFKLGYEKTSTKFVSQLGGVLPKYRGIGIANELMVRQHRWCFRRKRYKVIQTESMNRYRDMMALNLRHDFAIIGTYYDKAYEDVKIIFEKRREN